LLFGPKKLPEIAKTIGKGVQQIKNAQANLTAQMNSVSNEIETEIKKETESLQKPLNEEVQKLKRDQMFD
jgi:Sec-independent protein translocase protein TatA